MGGCSNLLTRDAHPSGSLPSLCVCGTPTLRSSNPYMIASAIDRAPGMEGQGGKLLMAPTTTAAAAAGGLRRPRRGAGRPPPSAPRGRP